MIASWRSHASASSQSCVWEITFFDAYKEVPYLQTWFGDFGRTPKVNPAAGRDHWSMTQSVLFAGGGIKPGLVLGATDRTQTAPTTDPVSVEDILHTVFRQMGIDPTKTYYTPLGRPVPIVNGGRVIPGLV